MMNHKPIPKSIDEYIGNYSEEIIPLLKAIRQTIIGIEPDFEETIRYQIPTFRWKNQNLVHFAAFKKHIGFYPGPSGLKAFSTEISKYKNAKGSVQFPLDQPLPIDLIERIVRFRVNEVD